MPFDLKNRVVMITGATAGIGRSCAEAFAGAGATLVLAARRKNLLAGFSEELSSRFGTNVFSSALDVTRRGDVESFFASLPEGFREIDVLVNNAGLARGIDKLQDGSPDDWDETIDTNIKGLLYCSKCALKTMVARNSGHIINIGSLAGHEVYPGGNVYCATKYAIKGLTKALKLDLLGTAIRVSSVDPGMVETDFSKVRFKGDLERAKKVYANLTPLTPADVADAVLYCASRPAHVNINEVVMMPVDQSSTTAFNRR